MLRAVRAWLTSLIEKLRASALARGTGVMFLGLISRVLIQAVYFILIARALDADGYGAFLGALALAAVAVPFASWGTGHLLIQDVAREPELFARRWGSALLVTTIFGVGLSVAVVGISRLVLPSSIPPWLIVWLAGSELLCARYSDIAGQAFWAFGRLKVTAFLTVFLSVARLAAAVGLLLLVAEATPLQWGVAYFFSSLATAATALGMVHQRLGRPVLREGITLPRLKEGFFFSLGQSAGGIYSEIDKTMLTRLSTLSAAGIYGAASRIIEVAFAPMLSLLMASYTEFFRRGEHGIRGTVRLARRLVPAGAGYGAVTGLGLFLCAPLIPLLLGEGFSETVAAIRWLAVIPLLRAVQFLGADTLTGAGHQALRSGMYVVVAVLNVGLNLWLIPRFSWVGAAWASIASDAFLLGLVWAAVLWLYWRSPEPASISQRSAGETASTVANAHST